jgi:hypothetical protein
VSAQDGPKDWTEWQPANAEWAQFQAVVEFRGGSKSREDLVKNKPASFKLKTLIGGRLKGQFPAELSGVRTIRIIYSEYGKFETIERFYESAAEFNYIEGGQNIRSVTILRPASAFDIDEAAKPRTDVAVTTPLPGVLAELGVSPGDMDRKISGRVYRLGSEWRRKGKTVEIRLKDYRPE